jgi:predicted metalloprotease with PDZ domain
MMEDLSKKYGIDKPFKDKCLFKDIGKITGYKKEMKDFFGRYVAGAEALPIADYMAEMGIDYQEEGTVVELSQFGFDLNTGITFNRGKMMIELKESGIDPFGKDIIGFKGGDLLYKWQGEELTIASLQSVLGQHQMGSKEGDDLSVVVLRQDDSGQYKEVELSGALKKVPVKAKHVLLPKENATPEQLALRKAWLGDYKTES